MKRFITQLVALALFQATAVSQSCLPDGIGFDTQSQIDSFQVNYPGCTTIEGDVDIFPGSPWNTDPIHNLDGLSILTSIEGNLWIGNCYMDDLTGLQQVTSIGGNLTIDSDYLTSLSGLNNLTVVGGSFILQPRNQWVSGLADITALNHLQSVAGDFIIGSNNLLTSLTGLDNLNTIGGTFTIASNQVLTNLEGMPSLNSIGGLWITNNDSLQNLTGLESLENIKGDLHIMYNESLTGLTGLDNIYVDSLRNINIYENRALSICDAQLICNYLASPSGIINIFNNASGCNNPAEIATSCGFELGCLPYGNYVLTSQNEVDDFQLNYPGCSQLEGDVVIGTYPGYAWSSPVDISNLDGLTTIISVGGNLVISGNELLINLSGLDNLFSVEGYLDITGNSLTTLDGLGNLTSVGGYLAIQGTPLTDLKGLDKLNHIGEQLIITLNPFMVSLEGLENLTSIGGAFYLWDNTILATLAGLNNLNSIGGELIISGNDVLASLAGLDNIDANSISYLIITYNPLLSACEVQSICNYLALPNSEFTFGYNEYGCSHYNQVAQACGLGLEETTLQNNLCTIYPNPFSGETTFNISLDEPNKVNLVVMDRLGRIVSTVVNESMGNGDHHITWNAEGLPSGIYFYRLTANGKTANGKMVVVR